MRSVFFTNEFKPNIRQFAKKYRRIKSDIQPVIETLQRGETPGDRIPRLDVAVYKVRVANTDANKGTRGGYRIVYTKTDEQTIILVTMYSRTEQSDVSPDEIAAIITAYEKERDEAHDETES
ncbi:MAG: type II toxin-antitoxin system RelE/ParE family toxin [Oscillochloridaceae bacterium umkhey_bin13]